ncbi:MAG: lactate utilization protein B [Bacteroidales bacterium]
MSEIRQQFLKDSEQRSFDLAHRKIIAFNMGRYDAAVQRGKMQFKNLELARRQAGFKKYRALENLENMLRDFEQNFTSRGGKVIWARDTSEAREAIAEILLKRGVKLLVKSKSMVTEELQLDSFLHSKGIETVETDLGEYIVQITGDKPYHIVTPVMHKSAKDIAAVFHEKFGLDPDSSPAQIAGFVRTTLRGKFMKSGAGITGANFLVASSGSVALTENEGNGVLSATLPPLLISVAGIEKVIENMDDLHLFWPLLATFGTGQQITAYNSLISGPRQKDETDGPREMYVILLDNGRTRLLSRIPQRRALSCIRCGSCLNACPIYRNVGGHTYGSVYSGPIGAVITPHLQEFDTYKHLSFASSLCGKCTEVCPVNIDLHYQLLQNRNFTVTQKLSTRAENLGMRIWKMAMLKPSLLSLPKAGLKNYFVNKLFAGSWGKRRDLPRIQPKSFRQMWKEENG